MDLRRELFDWKWSAARRFLPFDLDGLAVDSGALVRRRCVEGGEALVRLLLLVGLPKASLERAAQMAREAGLAAMSGPALFKRLVRAESLLRALFFHTLRFSVDVGERWGKWRLLAVDATALCGPGATGTDQRLHTVYDLNRGLPLSVDITGPSGGEALWRHHSFGPGDLVLGDSGYGYNNSFLWALNAGASILIRFNFQTVKLYDEQGERIWADAINATLPDSGTVEVKVTLPGWSKPLRAIGARNPKGEPVWLVTDLSQEDLPASQVRELYRKRWQVELYFKRLKSLVDLDEMPTRDGPTARPWIWAKLVLASLAVLLGHERFSPWGCPDEEAAEPVEARGTRDAGAHASTARTSHSKTTRKAQRETKTEREADRSVCILEA